MRLNTWESLSERQRVGVLLLCGRAAQSVLRIYPPITFQVLECRWAAEAIDMARMDGSLLDLPEVTRILQATPEGSASRWDFVGSEWITQTIQGVPNELNADLRELNQRGCFSV